MVPWEFMFTSHGHAVVFQLLDIGEKPMAMHEEFGYGDADM